MPMRRQQPRKEDNFQEAIAQWRLDLRTEVKRTSSLPTAMFDACDPMLETRLAETAEAMLARLQEPAPTTNPKADGEKRIELVTPAELQQLPTQIAAAPEAVPDLDAGLDDEFLGALADAGAEATGEARDNALTLLAREFEGDPSADLDNLTQQLCQRVQAAITTTAHADVNDDELAAICRRIVATVTGAQGHHPVTPPPEPPR